MKSRINLFLLVIFCATQFSCKNDSDTLIGEWLRSDFSANSEYRLTLEENNSGYIANRETTKEGVISNAISINWITKDNVLTISQDNGDTTTSYEFTSNGNLILADFSEFEFIKQ